ncbi:MAG TPA: adenylate/guanylate cyclase domain-containing protein [Anaerolineae bacterium]|nr:adenylate/guanylate cyclase domain-containing protein [Anaerolineae bacterium]
MPSKFSRRRRSNQDHSERRTITLLFCDVANSTQMASQLDAEEWLDIMDNAFDYLIPAVERYGGTVTHLMGDAVLALFGAPTAHEDDPQRAILAGLAMLTEIQPLQEEIEQNFGLQFQIRVGINTGPVVVGKIGAGEAIEYTAMGDAVNVAARMEQTAAAGTVQISEDTYQLVAPLFEVTPLGPLTLKGKAEPMPAYRVLRPKNAPGRLRGLKGVHAPLVGRQSEFSALQACLDGLQAGHGHLVFLVGEAGLGKSRLIRELHAAWQHAQLPPSHWITGRALSYDSNRPYGLSQQLLRQLLNVTADDTSQLMAALTTATPHFPAEHADAWREALATVITSHPTDDGAHLEGDGLRRQLFAAVTALITTHCHQNRMTLICDDLHWADDASLALIEHLLPLINTLPLMILAATRPEQDTPAWALRDSAQQVIPAQTQTLRLQPLKPDESDSLINHLLAIADLPLNLRQQLLQKTEGNPFFLEEVVRSLIDDGIVIQDETGLRWQATTDQHSIDVPDNIESLLMARIDKLAKDVRRTLQLAAVIGRYFSPAVLATVRTLPAAELADHLLTLQTVELIQRLDDTDNETYLFRHMLTRDAAYRSILRRERRLYHQQVGQAMVDIFGDRVEEEAHRIADHFAEGEQFDLAMQYYRQAGDAAARLHANQEAVKQYQRGLTLATTIEPLSTELVIYFHERLGRVWETHGQQEQALALYQSLEALADQHDKPAWRITALLSQATLHATPSSLYNDEKAASLAQEAQQIARQLNDFAAEAKAYWVLLLVGLFSGTNEECIRYGQKGLALARQHNLTERRAYLLNDIARAYTNEGRIAEAIDSLAEAQEIWRQLENWAMLSDNLAAMANSLLLQGKWSASVQTAQEGVQISQRTGNLWGQSYNMMALGQALLQQGKIGLALNYLIKSLPIAEAANFRAPLSFVAASIARIYQQYGNKEKADQYLQQSIQVGQANPQGFAMALNAAVNIHLDRDNLAEANHYAQEISKTLNISPTDFFLPQFTITFLRLAIKQADYKLADNIYNSIIDYLSAAGFLVFQPSIYLLKAEALMAQKQYDSALDYWHKAYQTAHEIDLTGLFWQLDMGLTSTYIYLGQKEDAEKAYQSALKNIAWCRQQLGSADAVALFNQSRHMDNLNQLKERLDALRALN